MPDVIQLPAPPDVKIIKDGKEVDTSAIDDYDAFMASIFQASIAANTIKIRKYYDDRTSKGEVESFWFGATPVVQEVRCTYPSQSIHAINDGPGNLFIVPNNYMDTPAFLNQRGEYTLDFGTHKLKRFYVWSAPGTVATVRAWVKY